MQITVAMIEITAKIAKILGRADDAEKYEALAGRVRDAFNRRFFNQAGHCYEDASQFSNGFPLFPGMVPEEERAEGVKFVKMEADHAVFQVLSGGDYTFVSRPAGVIKVGGKSGSPPSRTAA